MSCHSPIDGSRIAVIAACGPEDVEEAVAVARRAFESGIWRNLPPSERKLRLMAFAEEIESRSEELSRLETLDMGKPIRNVRAVDLPETVKTFRYYAEALDKIYDEIGSSPADAVSMIVREPLGVVAAITPWNYPLMLAAWKIAPALAAGNSVILKPAEQASLTALWLGELAALAGIPDGVFGVLPGDGEVVGKALCLHDDVDGVAFTGSTTVGKQVMGYAGQSNLKRVALECGGKSPQIIFADCLDLDAAAEAAAWGFLYDQGQNCTAGSRLLVEETISEDFLAQVASIVAGIAPGNPLDEDTVFGAIVDAEQMNTILDYVDAGEQEGAVTVSRGGRALAETGGYYLEPTVFGGVDPSMTIAREEIFGPVLSTFTFRNFDEAMKLANDSAYGLAAGVWTRDIDKAHRAVRTVRAGTVWLNCWDESDITTPFGGFKQSGIGRDRSLHAFDKYTELKTVWLALGSPA